MRITVTVITTVIHTPNLFGEASFIGHNVCLFGNILETD